MTLGRQPRGIVLFFGCSIVWLVLACGDSSGDSAPSWNCVILTDGCTCSQPRPGLGRKPGVMYVDRCPAAGCCVLNSQADESALAYCGCFTIADDCAAKATDPQSKVVAACPPP